MELSEAHVLALDEAETLMFHSDFCPYLELKEMFPDRSDLARRRFRILFTNFYGMKTGGLTDAFHDRFFEILFGHRVMVDGQPDYEWMLLELGQIKRRKGDLAMPFSFVSKLAAMHCESSPIIDQHVLNFFGIKRPNPSLEKAVKIRWFVDFLGLIGRSYSEWACDIRVEPILRRLKVRDTRLAACDAVRLMDFLVWKAGNQGLLEV